ncbi:1,4-alpha-glucan branching enzyme GlgB [Planctomycetes bacterium Pan216]|uniref:1,4-alpha-glucan branching enzyme GlgB n=1 Tax=Kolteria novifilia TaxID=2527975 RepID=A0A518BAC7_9BACT|nr:1,4-alpha-glucan branching enzyme GlgB [Planctomycetes bacterium Pan216]
MNANGSPDTLSQASTSSASSVNGLVSSQDVDQFIAGRHRDPFGILGPHQATKDGLSGVVIRCYVPGTESANVLLGDQPVPMTRIHEDGFFEVFLPGKSLPMTYRFQLQPRVGVSYEMEDAYRFSAVLGDVDLHLIGEGTHYKNYERLGSHACEWEGVRGVSFAVWAPNASRVSVVGDFNHWDGRRNPMRFHPGAGVWDIFIPELDNGTVYKFELLGPNGEVLPLRSDPYGFHYELRPKTATIVHDINQYQWNDQDWIAERDADTSLDQPIAVYEVHFGSWMRDPGEPERLLSYGEVADRLIPYVKDLGYTHIQLLPITEHPFDGSWGYQTLGYFAPTSRYGTPEDFMSFVDRCHQNDIAILIDWVPAHFPKDDFGLRHFDGTALYEHQDPRQGEHPDWGTLIFNYGRNEVSNFLLGSALFWFEKYHIDGIRVDAVASMLYLDYGRNDGEWIPNQFGGNENLEAVDFLKRLNELIHADYPGVLTIAEESTAWAGVSRPTYLGGLGFSIKWNMGWMNDTLRYMHREPIYRKYHQNDLTFSLIYAFTENFMLPLSHDEVVHGKGALLDKMPGDFWQRFANLRLLYCYMYGHPGKKLLFMGGEFGQWCEWRYEHSLDWHLLDYGPHQGVQRLIRDLNHLMIAEKSLHEVDFEWTGFAWVDFHDWESSIVAFLRKGKEESDQILFVINFTPVPRDNYCVGVPFGGFWKEALNSDSEIYGGSNVGNDGGVMALEQPCHELPFQLNIKLPPLGCVVFKPSDAE